MKSFNDLYRKLAKKYHPDTTSSTADKALLEQMMVEINQARECGDLETLLGIENLGPVYIAARNYERVHRAQRESHVEKRHPSRQTRRPDPNKAVKIHVISILQALHPYALWSLLKSWEDHGAVKKLFTLTTSIGWMFLFYSGWGLLNEASRLLAYNGFGHESVPGLIIVLLRGALIVASTPCVLPNLFLAFMVGITLGAAWLCSTILSSILGYFHPLLALLPPWIMGTLLVLSGCCMLKKG